MLNENDFGDAAARMAFTMLPQRLQSILESEAKNQGCDDPLLLEKVTPSAEHAFTIFRSNQFRILAGSDGAQYDLANTKGLFSIE